ncbi:translation initiation factor [Colletotrichum karsti]|uniref:Translation initiation factor n=1 Tax=Colletotrichum karsti TaxID=1095194 RepID=A0A9P6I2Y1_9PEZI|nr:translation initiation factor [Colletotrichum karsti]KAF9874850.1 translation initiation factor [Colletotrichum karsti]
MRVTRCLFNSRTALHRVFVSPFEKVEALSRQSALLIPSTRVLQPISAPIPSLARHASMVHRFKKKGGGAPDPTSSGAKKGPLENDEITDRQVMIVNEENKLEGPFDTFKVVRSLDLDREVLRMVSEARGPRHAICKIINIEALREREREQEQARKENAKTKQKSKDLELNWAIAPHDLGHKLKQLRTFLEKGFKVEVLLAKKKGSRTATRDEAETLIQTIRDLLADTPGARETKAPEGTPLKVMRMYLTAPVKGSTAWIEAKAAFDRLAAEKAAAEAALAEQEALKNGSTAAEAS